MHQEEWKIQALACKFFDLFEIFYYKQAHLLLIRHGRFPDEFIRMLRNKGFPKDVINGIEEKMRIKYWKILYEVHYKNEA